MNTDFHGWGSGPRRDAVRTADPTDPCSIRVSSVAQESPVREATVSLTMIVKNEKISSSKYLTSVAGLFDGTVVVDTGSKDPGAPGVIATEFGAHRLRGVRLGKRGARGSPPDADLSRSREIRTRPLLGRRHLQLISRNLPNLAVLPHHDGSSRLLGPLDDLLGCPLKGGIGLGGEG